MKVLLGLIIISTLYACAFSSVRRVSVEPGKGGVLAVWPQDSEEARAKANLQMSNVCQGKNYEITKEEEAVIGQVTRGSQNTQGGVSSGSNYGYGHNNSGTNYSQNTDTSSYTTNKTEWRVTFKCK